LQITEFNKDGSAMQEALEWLKSGNSVGVISESGMPGIADPGSEMVKLAHRHKFNVVALVGPSSILLALCASGLNGQSFAFHGYLPIKEAALQSKLKSVEHAINKDNQTQIFIETPYRNDKLLNFLIRNLNPQINLCIAKDITGDNQLIVTKSIGEWQRESNFSIDKFPTIFLLGR
jgi:16S rRNA (cytidine1402-2'-O)-methyltransferase